MRKIKFSIFFLFCFMVLLALICVSCESVSGKDLIREVQTEFEISDDDIKDFFRFIFKGLKKGSKFVYNEFEYVKANFDLWKNGELIYGTNKKQFVEE